MALSVIELTENGPDHVLDWLTKVQSHPSSVPSDMNWWLGLAEISALYATDNDAVSQQDVLKWGFAALKVYDHLSDSVAPEGRNGFECSAMFMRASMIERFGIIPDHPILDSYSVQQWFFNRLSETQEEIVNKAKHWKDLPIEQIRQLRSLKNRLLVIEFFVKNGYVQDNELSEWIQIRGILP